MTRLKKRLNDEFDAIAPPMRSDVRNAPIVTAEKPEKGNRTRIFGGRKTAVWSAVAVAACMVTVLICLAATGVFRSSEDYGYVFKLDINPSAAFLTDSDGKVTSVKALNADADVVLSDGELLAKIEDAPLSDAVVAYADAASKLGYLDLDASENVVRFSVTDGDSSLTDDAADKLGEYFKSKGVYVAVWEERVSVKKMCEMLGVETTEKISVLTNELADTAMRYGERISAGKEEEELFEVYESYILDSGFFGLIRTELGAYLSDIVENARLLARIGICNCRVYFDPDNPALLPADYWSVVKLYSESDFTEEFAALLTETEALLDEYEAEYGTRINSRDEFYEELKAYAYFAHADFEGLISAALNAAADGIADAENALEAFENLANIDFGALFERLTPDAFADAAGEYLELLKKIGVEHSGLEALKNAPRTAEDFDALADIVLKAQYESRLEIFAEGYYKARPTITDSEYEEFLNRILAEYGSMENFWSAKKSTAQ